MQDAHRLPKNAAEAPRGTPLAGRGPTSMQRKSLRFGAGFRVTLGNARRDALAVDE